ncbi:MAG: diaminopimelate dehydrogenase [Micrococcaceae bacterium]|nr:diaminopimelate dehydrogenase [Micrococcaceae bacterium]
MGATIRIGIAGYGNLGRGVQAAIAKNPDMELVGVFTRRDPATLSLSGGASAFHMDELARHTDDIDVLILCGGSKTDLPEQGPLLASQFNTVDSFDTHAKIPEHFAAVDAPATAAGKTALISAGWDPGMFSINRVYGEALVPDGQTYTFWGRGLSQGHSDAIRRVPGVAAGVQYTIPSTEAIAKVRAGERPTLSTREKHVRECFVVLEDGANAENVRESIVTMEHYFDQYDTTVNFIDAATLASEHSSMPHGGFVFRSGNTTDEHAQVIEYSLTLGSNPEFTSSVLVAYARAVHKMNQAGQVGAKTVFDVAPGLLSPRSPEQLRAEEL